jgi:hypothetical protein
MIGSLARADLVYSQLRAFTGRNKRKFCCLQNADSRLWLDDSPPFDA